MIPVQQHMQDILVENVDVPLLRQQCHDLLAHLTIYQSGEWENDNLMGIVMLLETMIDIADGEPQR